MHLASVNVIILELWMPLIAALPDGGTGTEDRINTRPY